VALTVGDNYGLTSATVTQSIVVSTPSLEEAAKQREEAAASEQREQREREEEALARAAGKREEATAPPLTANLQEVAAFHAAVAAAVPDAELASTALLADASGHVVVEISCPARETSCAGTVTLRTLSAVSAEAGAVEAAGKGATILTLAKGSFTVVGGRSKKLTLRLSAKGRTLLARSHAVRVRATITAHDPAGASHTSQRTATLRSTKRKPAKG
jgi:hypothetical protein